MQTEMETFAKEAARDSKAFWNGSGFENRERYDYKEFLRKFSVLKEEMQVDPDSFDYIFYTYGLEHYGNMPLIEPLETKEVRKIEDFVIVIDTSMSCKGELIRHFLEETYSVLSESESFFRKINVHIIQCDEKIREDQGDPRQQGDGTLPERFYRPGLWRNGLPPGLRLCITSFWRQAPLPQAPGTDLLYGRLWAFPGENAALRYGLCLYAGGLPGHRRTALGDEADTVRRVSFGTCQS